MMCHDCKKEIETAKAEYEHDEKVFYKCESCFKIDENLRNFRETEVYSRVVGYIRPVNQWNKGKKEEYKDRVAYINGSSCCTQ